MKRNFTNENFEEFLRRSAENLQMRPSAKVWEGISNHFNRRRRIGIIMGVSLLITTSIGYFVSKTNPVQNNNQVANNQITRQVGTRQHTSSDAAISKANKKTKRIRKVSHSIVISKANNKLPGSTSNASGELKNAGTFSPIIVDSYNEQPLNKSAATSSERWITDPLTIESVINSYQQPRRKLGWQLYFTPTVIFRKVNDNTINTVAPDKPNFGFEVGFAAKYPLTKNLRLKGGIQFNVNSYSVKTFETYTQTATIRVNDPAGAGYITALTNYNNFSGYQSEWLRNFYFQVSAPVGLELKLKGDNATQFGIASTLQPTYLLGGNAYLISSDYKNYASVPNLIRHWNVNTSFETYVAYSTGRLKWQVGPQVRYQLLSSYVKKYPVKEKLFDFGLRVGISLNNR